MNLNNSKYIEVFKKYNYNYENIDKNDINDIFIEISKIENIKYSILKKIIFENNNLNLQLSYDTIFLNFKKSSNEKIINYIKIIKLYIKYIDSSNINELINCINHKLTENINNKEIYSQLKQLLIYINKFNNDNKRIIKKNIEKILFIIDSTKDFKKISYFLNKIFYFLESTNDLNINKNIIKYLDELILKDINLYNYDIILNLISKCKKNMGFTKNITEKLLYSFDNNLYQYIYFLKNKYEEKEDILNFIKKFNFNKTDIKDIDSLNLKRGFVQSILSNDKSYILKYQPNKSRMELIINCYLKTINSKYFLLPKLFFMNSNNSYFYFIEKYNTDLNKYFKILELKSKILNINDIIKIKDFLLFSIKELHLNNIIHSDIKLENIVINLKNNEIDELKIIDFDVSIFNEIPIKLNDIPEKYIKILQNKKIRGTRIYMLKSDTMSFNNDIYSIGVLLLILLYKNTKLAIQLECNNLINTDIIKNNKKILKYQDIIDKLNSLKEKIEDDKFKIKLLNSLLIILRKNNLLNFFNNNQDFDNLIKIKNIISDCIYLKKNIDQLINIE